MNKYAPYILLLCFAILPVLPITAQEDGADPKQYSFINSKANVLHYDTASVYMHRFFDKWRRIEKTGQGNLNIVHIGGSHVQAGVLPNTIRCNLLNTNTNMIGPRGLIFPYSAAARCNNPPDYRVHCPQPMILTRNVHKEHTYPLGACGIAVTASNEPTEIAIVVDESIIDYHIDRVVLLGHSDQGIVPRLRLPDREIYPSFIDQRSERYVYNLGCEVDSFNFIIPCREGDFFSVSGIYLDSRNNGISYHSIGVNGAAVPDYLRCQNFVRDMRLLHPDVVVFGIGINDAVPTNFDTAAFRSNYLSLVDSIRYINPDCAFIFVTNNDSYRKTGRRRYLVNTNGELAREVFYRLASDVGGAVWDQFEVMGGLKSMEKWYKAKLARVDRVHFTAAGYRLVGDLFSSALLDAYKAYCLQQLPRQTYRNYIEQ